MVERDEREVAGERLMPLRDGRGFERVGRRDRRSGPGSGSGERTSAWQGYRVGCDRGSVRRHRPVVTRRVGRFR